MCNLYRMTKPAAEVANLFRVADATAGSNRGAEVYPGYPGLVVTGGVLMQMTWGFPLVLKGKQGQPLKPKPVNNARTDKLATAFWKSSFENRRCLIPLNAFAEAEGEKGRMRRTWLLLPDQPMFACAGIWRWSDEWGDVYSMVMTDPCDITAEVHDRMPVILDPHQWSIWTNGTPGEAFALCQPYRGSIAIERTGELWVKTKG